MPERFSPLLAAAEAGTLPRGMVKLPGGMVPDLAGYVLAWAACWGGDDAHVTRRLDEVRTWWGR